MTRSRRADFGLRIGEEADETAYWLELLKEAEIVRPDRLSALIKACDELTAIVVASIRTARPASRRQ